MSYHIFNNLAELLNRDLAAKIGRGIFSKDIMDRKCNCSFPYKVNKKCVYEGKCLSRCIFYEVTWSICDSIYIGNTQKIVKKIMDGHFSDLQRPLKNRQKSDSFVAHLIQHLITNMACTDLRKYMAFKVVKQLVMIGMIETFTRSNCNPCMQERLMILKKLCDKRVTVMNKNLEIYGACRHKTTFFQFCLSTDDPVFNRWKG